MPRIRPAARRARFVALLALVHLPILAHFPSLVAWPDVIGADVIGSSHAALRSATVVAISGTPAPGTPVNFANAFDVRDAFLASEGRVVFGAPLADGGYAFYAWRDGTTSLLARHGTLAPGFASNAWDFLTATRFGMVASTGEHLLVGGLRMGDTFTGKSLWVGPGPALGIDDFSQVEGAIATAVDALWVSIPLSNTNPPVVNGGQAVFAATIEDGPAPGASVNSNNDSGLWITNGPVTAVIAREGSQMPGMPPNTLSNAFGDMVLLPDGAVYFTANAKLPASAFGIFRVVPGGALELVAPGSGPGEVGIVSKLTANANRTLGFVSTFDTFPAVARRDDSGMVVAVASQGFASHGPDGVADQPNYMEFFHLVVAGNDSLLFLARTANGKRGIWAERDGAVRRLVWNGDPAVGTSGNQTFLNITQMTANENGVIAFEATTSGNGGNTGWWVIATDGAIRPLILPLDTIELAPGDTRTVTTVKGPVASFTVPSEYGHGKDGVPAFINAENLLLQVYFNNFASAALVIATFTSEFVVNHTGSFDDLDPGDGICDDGGTVNGLPRCTLRAAIQEANANPGSDRIRFDIPQNDIGFDPGTGTWEIPVSQELPEVTDSAFLDAGSQPGYNGIPRIVLNGFLNGTDDFHGLTLAGGSSRVHAFAIGRCFGDGIHVSGGSGHRITANWIGLRPDGTKFGSNGSGVEIVGRPNNVIGGSNPADRNVLGDNGLMATGGDNIHIEGAGASGNRVAGNYVGVAPDGTTPVGGAIGINIIDAPDNLIGGNSGSDRNLVGGGSSGIEISGALAVRNRIEGNFIGLGADGETPVSNSRTGIRVSGAPDNVIGGATGVPGSPPGNVITASHSDVVRAHGIDVGPGSHRTRILGNLVGSDASGIETLGNSGDGIRVRADSVDIGGADATARNVIVGNDSSGVHVLEARGATIRGNIIGLGVDGDTPAPNARSGILLEAAPDAVIGGLTGTPGAPPGNVVSANRWLSPVHGIEIRAGSDRVRVFGNLVGTDATGLLARGNGGEGILADGVDSLVVGSLNEMGRNIVAANDSCGVRLSMTRRADIAANALGVRRDLADVLGNALDGLRLEGARRSEVERNIVGGNGRHGVHLASAGTDSNDFRRNEVGLQTLTPLPLPNLADGIRVDGGNDNRFGGDDPDDGNRSWYNHSAGLRVRRGTANEIRGNTFFANIGLGIDLGTDSGVNPNDDLDADTGANRFQNYPVLTAAVHDTAASTIRIRGVVNAAANGTFRVQLFGGPSCDPFDFGEGRDFLAEVTVGADEDGGGSFEVVTDAFPAGDPPAVITATATDAAGNTSEFSACRPVTIRPGNVLVVNSTGDLPDLVPGDGTCDTGGLVGAEAECTLRAALAEAAALAGPETIEFAIDGPGPFLIGPATPLPAAGNLAIDAASQPGYAGTPLIVLDGVGSGSSDGLVLGGQAAVQALGVVRFGGNGLVVGGEGNNVALCWVGIDPATGEAAPNGADGVLVTGGMNRIGGPDGAYPNRIGHNGGAGVRVMTGSATTISGNAIFGNGRAGIDLAGGAEDGFGVTANDPGDADSGPNDLQNAPVVTGALITGDILRVTGTLSSSPGAAFRLEFFAGASCDARGNGGRSAFLGSLDVTTAGDGMVAFDGALAFDPSKPGWPTLAADLAGEFVTATATDAAGSTSEYASCGLVERVPVTLLTWRALLVAGGVHLEWSVVADAPPVGFRVERRPAGTDPSPWTDRTGEAMVRWESRAAGGTYHFLDPAIAADLPLEYRLVVVERSGAIAHLGPFTVTDAPIAVPSLAARPNPSRGPILLTIELPAAGEVRVELFDVAGRLVRTLGSGHREAGRHELAWDGRTGDGTHAPAGVYLARLDTGGVRLVIRLVRSG